MKRSEPRRPVELQGLRELHKAMERQGEDRASFHYKNNKAMLEVIFFVDEDPFALLIAVHGRPSFAFEVPVIPAFRVDPFLGPNYGRLLDALGVESNPSNRFSASKFFRDLGEQGLRASRTRVRRPEPEAVARRGGNFEERHKTFFAGWMLHSNRRVTQANLDKTRRLLGQEAYERCRRGNISSVWSSDSRLKRPPTPPRGRGDRS